MNALFIARMLLVASSVVPYLVFGQTSREPDQPSVRFSYPLSETSETTKIRGHKYDHGEVAELPEGTNVGSTNDHWWIGLTALPVTDSSLIFVGSVSKEHPFLSPDQTGVYTVYTFSIRRLFKNDLHFVSSSVEIDRRGGVVKFPSGKLQEYSVTIMINFPEQQVTVLTAKAKAQGLTLEGWFRRVADNEASLRSTAHFQKTDPEAWILHLEASVARLPKMPVLSDEAMSRESIYSGRS